MSTKKSTKEIWTVIPDTGGACTISTSGIVESSNKRGNDKTIKPQCRKNGLPYITFKNVKTQKIESIILAKAVAKAHVPNPHNYTNIINIDGDEKNVSASNLKWVKSSDTKKNNASGSVKVMQFSMDGKFIAEYASVQAAALATNTNATSISNYCGSIRKMAHAGNYKWQYSKLTETIDDEKEDRDDKPIPPGKYNIASWYSISTCGKKLYDNKNNVIIPYRTSKDGDLIVQLKVIEGELSNARMIARPFHVKVLVAAAHLDNPRGFDVVRQIDGNKNNVASDNLAYLAPSVNSTILKINKELHEWSKRQVYIFRITYKKIDGVKQRLLWLHRVYKNISTAERSFGRLFADKLHENGGASVVIKDCMFVH